MKYALLHTVLIEQCSNWKNELNITIVYSLETFSIKYTVAASTLSIPKKTLLWRLSSDNESNYPKRVIILGAYSNLWR